jgi:DNA-binding response OmpR family regulator
MENEVLHARIRQKRRPVIRSDRETVDPWSYHAKIGRGTIRLTSVEYRILMFLAARPYHAFSRRRIAEAVSTESQPVTVDNLGRYIRVLRRQLGFYGDYVQAVPYIGYRFKA